MRRVSSASYPPTEVSQCMCAYMYTCIMCSDVTSLIFADRGATESLGLWTGRSWAGGAGGPGEGEGGGRREGVAGQPV